MVKPDKSQSIQLENLRDLVIGIMVDMEIWQNYDLAPLHNVKLGLLRKTATQRHGVTRWQRGITNDNISIDNIEIIELHPELLNQQWSAYAAFVLHHEFIHALGFRNHDSLFRTLEYSWPGKDAGDLGSKFTEFLRMKSAKWMWNCVSCELQFPRKKPSNGRYKCRKCMTTLVDVKI